MRGERMAGSAHPSTFSIVARDPSTEAVGVAVQSKFISVGAVVPFVCADAGAIATQSYANVRYGPDGLELLRSGHTAKEVLERLTAEDNGEALRQVGVVGQDGSVGAHTGSECHEYAGDLQGSHHTVQGNILAGERVIEAMDEAFRASEEGFPERLIAALVAGQAAGGDSRGKQSAALYIAKEGGGYDGGNDRWIDIRVDDHNHPIDELERIFKLYDVTLLSRRQPDTLRVLEGDIAEAVTSNLVSLGYLERPSQTIGSKERKALKAFRGTNNLENHDLEMLEHALMGGWPCAEGSGSTKLVDAIWHGLSDLPRA